MNPTHHVEATSHQINLSVIKNHENISFKDVNSFKNEIEFLVKKGIVKGYKGGYFKPNEPIKRLQAIQMILREKGITDFSNVPNPGYIDVKPGSYGYEEIAKATQLGIISGKTNAKGHKYFDTYESITRGQMSKIISRAYNLKGSEPVHFTDISKKSEIYPYVSALISNRITTGYNDGTFRPNETLTRQHFAAFMARYLNDQFKPSKVEINQKVPNASTVPTTSKETVKNTTLYEQDILELKKKQIIKGDYSSDDLVTRNEVTTMLARALGWPEEKVIDKGGTQRFIDEGNENVPVTVTKEHLVHIFIRLEGRILSSSNRYIIKDVSKNDPLYGYINVLGNYRMFDLYDGIMFEPPKKVTKGEFAHYLVKYLEFKNEEWFTDYSDVEPTETIREYQDGNLMDMEPLEGHKN